MDSRRLVRGVALQSLYELDNTDHSLDSLLTIRLAEDLAHEDARMVAFLALRRQAEGEALLPQPEVFALHLNKQMEERSPLEQVLTESLAETLEAAALAGQVEGEPLLEFDRQALSPEIDELNLGLPSVQEWLTLEEQRQVFALVRGVWQHRDALDKLIQQYAPHYPINQIAPLDRNLLRIALYQCAIERQVPIPVAISEAVELAKIYGADSTPRFINGVLGAISDHWPEALAALAASTPASQESTPL